MSIYDQKITNDELREFVSHVGPNTRIFFGSDSERYKENGCWYADYTCVIVIHIDGCHGGKVFAEVSKERDFDQNVDRPFNRLMMETQKIAELYLRTKELFYDFEVEVHLDIASNEKWGSNCAAQAAVGYIRGMCNLTPVLKNDSFAASFAADRGREFVSTYH